MQDAIFSGLKRVREFYRKQYEAWLKEGEAVERGKGKGKDKDKAQSFSDKISQLLVGGDSRRH